jgi:hypothetical protein
MKQMLKTLVLIEKERAGVKTIKHKLVWIDLSEILTFTTSSVKNYTSIILKGDIKFTIGVNVNEFASLFNTTTSMSQEAKYKWEEE